MKNNKKHDETKKVNPNISSEVAEMGDETLGEVAGGDKRYYYDSEMRGYVDLETGALSNYPPLSEDFESGAIWAKPPHTAHKEYD